MKSKNYASFDTDQFAGDPDFQRWVLHPSSSDLLFWQEFLSKHPEQFQEVNTARRLVLAAHDMAPGEMLSRERKQHLHNQLMENVRRENKRLKVRTLSLSAAAAVLLLIVATGILWLNNDWEGNDMVVITTPYGDRQEVVLPDGSKVILNANSTLTYQREWEAGADRRVQLSGEAHFTVTPQPATQAKFTVATDDLDVQVLGTVFNVHAREQGTRVTLEEGKVTLQLHETVQGGKTVKMEPGQQVLFSAQTQELITEKVNAVAQNSWKDGIITFDGITLGHLGEVIEETFGLPVTFLDSTLNDKLITGAGPADDLELLLETVEGAFGIKINRQDSLIVFKR